MKKLLPTILLLIIAIGVNIYFRLGAVSLPFTKDMAEDFVMGDIINASRKQVDEKFKDLPAEAKVKATRQLAEIMKQDKKNDVERAVSEKQKELRQNWQDKAGHTFLMEIDPYHWYRLTRNLVTTGMIGTRMSGKTEYDSFMLAPEGMKVEISLHRNLNVYLSAWLFKFCRLFNKDLSLMQFVFYMPVIIACFALIMAFFMCLSVSASKINLAGFFAAISLGLAPIFLLRSVGGWFDTDSYVILFSILSVWLFYLSFNYETALARRIGFALLCGLSMGLFSFTWDGWWYIFDLLLIAALLYMLNLYLMKLENPRDRLHMEVPVLSLAVFILSSLLFVGLFCGFASLKHIVLGPANIIFAKGYLQNQFWPNTFLTVDELRATTIVDVINKAGGVLVIMCGLIYMMITLLNKRPRDYKHKQILIFYFTIWMVIMIYVSLKATRFTLLLVIPTAISFGLFMEWAINSLNNLVIRYTKLSGAKIKAALFIVFCLLLVPFFTQASRIRKFNAPVMDANWSEVLNRIKSETAPGCIINSWWDFGHWFKAIAERPVIFDGATQNTPMAYWMGRFFVTRNETEAMGILRMLNSGSNKAFEELEKLGFSKYKSLEILNEIIVLKEDAANLALVKYIPQESLRQAVLRYTHHPRSACLIIEPSLIPKITPISFLGNWNFARADMYYKYRQRKRAQFISYLIKEYRYSQPQAQQIYDSLTLTNSDDALEWISRPYRYYNASKSFRKEGNLLMFDNDFVVDLSLHSAYFSDIRDGKWKAPRSLFYREAGTLKEVEFNPSDINFSVLLLEENGNYNIIVVDTELANSMLVRLYYLSGAGMKYFKPFITKELKDGAGKIIVYKVIWE